jgi:hypothetical protein
MRDNSGATSVKAGGRKDHEISRFFGFPAMLAPPPKPRINPRFAGFGRGLNGWPLSRRQGE